MVNADAASSRQRAADGWDRLCLLTGVSVGANATGWDRLVQAMLDDPSARLRIVRRLEAVVRLNRMLSPLSDAQFAVVTLRLGLTVDDQPVAVRSRQEVSTTLGLSVSRIAQLEREAIDDLRTRLAVEFPGIGEYVHQAVGAHAPRGDDVPPLAAGR